MRSRPGPWTVFTILYRVVCALAMTAGGMAIEDGAEAGIGITIAHCALTLLAFALLVSYPSRTRLLFALAVGGTLASFTLHSLVVFSAGIAAGLLVAYAVAPERRALPLNAMDRYFVVQDYPGTPINTQHFIDIDDPLDRSTLERAAEYLAGELPILRSFIREGPFGAERFEAAKLWVPIAALVEWATIPIFERGGPDVYAPLDFYRRPPFRIVHAPRTGGGFQLCLTIHHSAVDGEAGLLVLDRLVRRYNEVKEGRPHEPLPPLAPAPRFRDAFRPKGAKWILAAIRKHVHPNAKVGVQNAHLLDNRSPGSCHVRIFRAAVPEKLSSRVRDSAKRAGTSRHDLFASGTLRAVDALRQIRGDEDRPVRFLLPTNLRTAFGVPPGVGNFVSTINIELPPTEIRPTGLPTRLAKVIRNGRELDHVIETPVNLGVIGAILPPWLFRRVLQKRDADETSSFFSLLFSTMRSPSDATTLVGTKSSAVWVAGSLARRPGIGLVITSTGDDLALLAEYLSPLVKDETARALCESFIRELARLCDELESGDATSV